MSDLDRDLREMFQRHESDLIGPVATPERLVRRVRRRQAGMVLSATLGVVMLVAIAVAIVALGDDPNQRVPGISPTPSAIAPFVVGPAPDLGTTELGGIHFPVPTGWYLSTLDDHRHGSTVALSNFAPALTGPDPCAGMPADGVLLVIDPFIARAAASWPVDLRESPAGSLDCGSTHLRAAWTTGGRSFRAAVAIGPSATTGDRDLLRRTFGALAFDPSGAAVGLDGFGYCFTQRFDAFVVVASGSFGGRAWTVAENPSCGDGFGFAVSGDGGTTGGTGFSGLGGPTDVVVTDYLDRGDTFVLGGVPSGGTRVTIDAGGQTVSVPLIPLAVNRDVAAFVAPLDGIRRGVVTTRDASGDVLAAVRFSPGMDCEYRSVCAPSVAAGGIVARSLPDDPVAWKLEEHEGALTLLDEQGAVLGEVAATSGALSAGTVQLSQEGQGIDLVFGIASADTSAVLVYPRAIREPFAAQTVALDDGRLVYWIEPVHNDARAVATFDASCRPLAAVDATTSNPTAQPSVTTCSRIQGVW